MKTTLFTGCIIITMGLVATALGAAEPTLKFEKRLLMVDQNEAAAVGDINQDGHLDISAGRFWFAGPNFVPRPLRHIEDSRAYIRNNSEFLMDVDGDGWLDVVATSFFDTEILWYRNPGKEALAKGLLWQRNVLIDTKADRNEFAMLHDVDGDGKPELLSQRYAKMSNLEAWKIMRDASGKPTAKRLLIGEKCQSHGMGFGDINNDGREDILQGDGWLERPAGDNPFAEPWKFHADWSWHAACPMIVVDLDGDGRTDIIDSESHGFGLFWRKQLKPAADGKLQFEIKMIDKSWSQPHTLAWLDIDGDGKPELVTGKRWKAHGGKDPGSDMTPVICAYKWNRATGKWTKHVLAEGAGIGMQVVFADLNKDGHLDIVAPCKSGLNVLIRKP